VHIYRNHPKPADLEEHIREVVMRPRDPKAPASPNAKEVVDSHRRAARDSECNGINIIEPFLLFVGAADKGMMGMKGFPSSYPKPTST
jgi:hypothetical protein